MAGHRTAGHRTAVRFPPTVWRGLKLRALDYDTSAVALVRQALTVALEGDTAALAASSHQYRDIPGQLVTLDLPIRLYRRLRLAVIAHRSTAMAVVLAAIYASWPELVPAPHRHRRGLARVRHEPDNAARQRDYGPLGTAEHDAVPDPEHFPPLSHGLPFAAVAEAMAEADPGVVDGWRA